MADVCEITGTSLDIAGDVWVDATLIIDRAGKYSVIGGTGEVSIGEPYTIATNASGVMGTYDGGTFTTGFALVYGWNYYITPYTAGGRPLRRFLVAIPEGTTSATISAVLVETPAGSPSTIASPTYSTRIALVAAWTDGAYPDGTVISDGTVFYKASSGSTAITDLPGLVPFCPVGWCAASPEHFLQYNASDMTAGIQAAIDYCAATFGSGTFGQGAVVGLLSQAYAVADDDADGYALVIENSVSIKGQGENSTQIILNDATDVTLYIGKGNTAILADTTGVATVVGTLVQDIQFYNVIGSAPTAGAHIRADRSVVHVNRCHLINHYRGVELLGNPESCKITDSQITQGSNTGATVEALSAGIAVLRRQINATFGASAGYQDSGDSLYYIEPNSVYITNNNIRVGALTTQNGGDYALLVGAVDGLYASGNHFAWGTRACIGLHPEQANMSFTNINITGGLIDPLPGKTSYGVDVTDRYSVSTSAMGSIVLNGTSIAGCDNDGVRLGVQCRRFQINGGEIKGCGRYGVNITSLSVTDTIIDGVHIFNTDNDGGGTDAGIYLASGQRTTISNCNINDCGRGIQVASAATRTSILGNKFEALADEISIYLAAGSDISACEGNDIEESATIESAGAVNLPVGADKFYVTGTTDINNINATGAPPYDGREVTLVFEGVLNVTNAGNIASGGTIATTTNDVLRLVYDATAVKWLKVGFSAN